MPLLTRRRLLFLIPGGIAAGLLFPRPGREGALIAALCRHLFFLDGDPTPDDLQRGAAAEALIAGLPAATRLALRGDLHRLDLAARLLTGGHLDDLPPAAARAVLQEIRLEESHAPLKRLQEICALACFAPSSVQAELGYQGPL